MPYEVNICVAKSIGTLWLTTIILNHSWENMTTARRQFFSVFNYYYATAMTMSSLEYQLGNDSKYISIIC